MNKYLCKQGRSTQPLREISKDNVVQFKKISDETQLDNALQSIDTAKNLKENLSEEITEMMMESVMGCLTSYGVFTNHARVNTKDIIMIENSLMAALYRYYGLEHPLHEVTDEVFQIEDEDSKDN